MADSGAKKRIGAQQAMVTAHAEAAAKLDALIATPCRQHALDAIALCRRAAMLATKAHEVRQKAADKEKAAAVKARAAVKRRALALKASKQKKLKQGRRQAAPTSRPPAAPATDAAVRQE